jgi:maleamate amidohydrolase
MDDELDIYRRQGIGNKLGFGSSPALAIIDFSVGFNDPDAFGGGNIDAAVKRTVGLLEAARRLGMPVAFTRIMYAEDGSNAGVFCLKAPKLKELTMSNPLSHIVPELTPIDGEVIIDKTEASAFFGTSFAAWLAYRRVDTLIVAGATTSGCVRATVVDAIAHNIRPIVARDCVGDRAIGPHDANLFDMNQKYADVMDRDEIIATLDKIYQAGRMAAAQTRAAAGD